MRMLTGSYNWVLLEFLGHAFFIKSSIILLNEIVAYLELFCVVAQLVSLSNIDDNNGKKNIKRKRSIKQNKNSEHSSHFVPVLFPIIV